MVLQGQRDEMWMERGDVDGEEMWMEKRWRWRRGGGMERTERAGPAVGVAKRIQTNQRQQLWAFEKSLTEETRKRTRSEA